MLGNTPPDGFDGKSCRLGADGGFRGAGVGALGAKDGFTVGVDGGGTFDA
jgi:hypothetical protein